MWYSFTMKTCEFPECGRKNEARGLCEGHAAQRRKGKPLTPIKRRGTYNRRADGETRVGDNGYLYVKKGTYADGRRRWVLQHREIMAEHIGRPLLKHETVHHKNGNRADNRLSNLELWSTAQPYGQRVVDKLAYAREIIDLYGELNLG